MPSERSLYRKIQVVLDIIKGIDLSNVDDLVNEISARRLPIFFSRTYDHNTDTFVENVSKKVIARTIRLCQLLELISESGALAKFGREALRGTRFDAVVAGQARKVLRSGGIDFARINSAIRKRLQSDPPTLPTCAALWDDLEPEIPYAIFSRMMSLLVQAGSAWSSQRKIFLRVDTN
jgi:hypothetical protein